MYKEIEEFSLPRKILNCMSEPYAEMSKHDHGFLCGLLKAKCPKKVVEIGVCAGGTTGVIMECLSQLKCEAQVYSVDLMENCYRRAGKRTGYLFDEVREQLDNSENHQFLLGKYYPEIADVIGGDIDFLVLDTVHSLPGEFFDFLAALPYLKDEAVVVLHDVSLNLYNGAKYGADCTRILLSCVCSDKKYYNFSSMEAGCLPNIGAFIVDASTRENILNVFQTMSLSWDYMPGKVELDIYTNHFQRYYDGNAMNLWKRIITMQRFRKHEESINQRYADMDEHMIEQSLVESCMNKKYVFLYGAGEIGKKLEKRLESQGVAVSGFVVSDAISIETDRQGTIPVGHLSDVLNLTDEENRILVLATVRDEIAIDLILEGISFVSLPKKYLKKL